MRVPINAIVHEVYMPSTEDAKTAILNAFHQTLGAAQGKSAQSLSLSAATAMGMLIALKVSGMVAGEEVQALSEEVIKGLNLPDGSETLPTF